MRKIYEHHHLVLGRIFKDNEGIHAYQYNIAIMWHKYKYIGGVIQVSWLVFMRNIYVWLLNNG